jgi:hypothetical protein
MGKLNKVIGRASQSGEGTERKIRVTDERDGTKIDNRRYGKR